jgi:16S rRNA (guanine527-N7)-methyltransferase
MLDDAMEDPQVTSREFHEWVTDRARQADVALVDEAVDRLETYFRLLTRWNDRMNLTALPLRSPTRLTFDRLFLEPLRAAIRIANEPVRWFDLGSGGGSPAIPLSIARPALLLSMVESRSRKAAFLREAIRVLEMRNADVRNIRFEELVGEPCNVSTASLVTVRAIKADARLFATASTLLIPTGRLMLFQPATASFTVKNFTSGETDVLGGDPPSHLYVLERL